MIEVNEIAKLHGVWSTYYPSALKGDRNIHTERWQKAFKEFTFDEVREAIEILSNSWKDTYEPPMVELIKSVNRVHDKANAKKKVYRRRVSFPEEEIAALYKELRKKILEGKVQEEAILAIEERMKVYEKCYLLYNGEGWKSRYFDHFRVYDHEIFTPYKGLPDDKELFLQEHNPREIERY